MHGSMLQAFARRRSLLGATASTARGFAHIGAAAYQSAVRLAFRLAEEAEASGRPLSELLPAVPAGAERVAVAMSGGVDSSVAALIMRCAGLDVLGRRGVPPVGGVRRRTHPVGRPPSRSRVASGLGHGL